MNGQAGTGDVYTPTFMTIEPNGQISFDFDGHVHADGLDLDAGTTISPPDDRKVRWVRTTDGWVAAEEAGTTYQSGITEISELQLRSRVNRGSAPLGVTTAELLLQSRYSGPAVDNDFAEVIAKVTSPVAAKNLQRVILDQAGNSGFLQLLSTLKRRLEIGSANLFFNGSHFSDALVINHNLSAVPLLILACAELPSVGASGAVAVGYRGQTNTQFILQGEDVSGTALGPGSVPCFWAAVG